MSSERGETQPTIPEPLQTKLLVELADAGIQRVVVGAVIQNDDKVLLLERVPHDDFGGLVELPSGRLERNEKLDAALCREVREEIDLPVASIGQYVGYFDYTSGSGKKTRQLNFIVTVDDGEIQLSPTEHQAYYWVNPSQIPDTMNVSTEVRRTIARTLE